MPRFLTTLLFISTPIVLMISHACKPAQDYCSRMHRLMKGCGTEVQNGYLVASGGNTFETMKQDCMLGLELQSCSSTDLESLDSVISCAEDLGDCDSDQEYLEALGECLVLGALAYEHCDGATE